MGQLQPPKHASRCSRCRPDNTPDRQTPPLPLHAPSPCQTRKLFGGVGGVFHGAIVIGDWEYSFGYCVSGCMSDWLAGSPCVDRPWQPINICMRLTPPAAHNLIPAIQIPRSHPQQESGTGVYHVRPGRNPMYTFRETMSLGATSLDAEQVGAGLAGGGGSAEA
jgi:hypothetical protein